MSSVAVPETSPVRGLMKPPPVPLQAAVVTPVHSPPEQASGKVQALASSQGRVLFMCVQPLAGLQLSVVQTLWSSQLGGGPPTHVPPLHVSLVVQALPSLHGAVLFVWTQPVAGLQLSVVHTFPSSQLGAGPPTHVPPLHVTCVVRASPLLQGAVLFVWTQPVAGLQLSVVHTFPSSQLGAGPPTHVPPLHVSFVVQASPSLHGAVLFVWTQPVAGLQLSVVHTFPSSQLGAGPPTHVPPLHVSFVVQASPSLHGAVLFVCSPPVAGSQLSVVHTFPSSQLGAGPPTHVPPLHVSFVVQASPSLHGAVLFVWTQPVAGLQLSVVQTFPSSQLGAGLPAHVPPLQVSFVVQASPSLHGAVLFVWTQPVAALQLSVVQSLWHS